MYLHSLPREGVVIIKFRRLGYSMNHIASALGRSTSFIHRVLSKAIELGEHRFENRKLPHRTRQLLSRRRLNQAYAWMQLWQGFLLGLEAEPP